MTNSQHHGRRAARHVIALVAVILELSRTDVEYIYHSLNRLLPATKMEMKRRLCLETVQRFLAESGEDKTQAAFRAWRRSREADGQPEMSERQIRETLGAWDDAKAKAKGDPVLDPGVPRLRRSAVGIRVTPERARRALNQWVKDVPGGIRNNAAYERWARAANDDLADTDEPLHPVGAVPVLAAVGADDMAEAVREWDPEASSRPQARQVPLNAKDHRPKEWIVEDIERCHRYYKRPIRKIDYRFWKRNWKPAREGEREPVSEMIHRAAHRQLPLHRAGVRRRPPGHPGGAGRAVARPAARGVLRPCRRALPARARPHRDHDQPLVGRTRGGRRSDALRAEASSVDGA